MLSLHLTPKWTYRGEFWKTRGPTNRTKGGWVKGSKFKVKVEGGGKVEALT